MEPRMSTRSATLRAAQEAERRNDLATASELLAGVVAHAPDDPSLLLELGRVQRVAGRFREAVATLEQALSLSPDAPDVLYQLGSAVRFADPLHAYALHERLLQLRPNDPDA